MVPGFNVGYSTHIKGLQPIVSYHGLGGEFFSRLQVLIDGRSMNNATLGGVVALIDGRLAARRLDGRTQNRQQDEVHRPRRQQDSQDQFEHE